MATETTPIAAEAPKPTPEAPPAEGAPPAGSETQTPPAPETTPVTEEPKIDWGTLIAEEAEEEVIIEPPAEPVAPEKPVEVAPEPTPPVVEPVPAVTPAVTPPAAKPPEPAVQPVPVPAPEKPPEQPAASFQEQWGTWRSKAVDHYANSAYPMTEEQGTDLVTAPHEHMPKLAAQVTVNAIEYVFNTLGAALPGMITTIIEQQRNEGRTQRALLQGYPKLQGREVTYRQVMENYRKLNPELPVEELVRLTGVTTYQALGLTADAPAPGGNGETPPAAPVSASVVPAEAVPFTPATPGAGGPAVAATGPKNPWADMDAQWSKEDNEDT